MFFRRSDDSSTLLFAEQFQSDGDGYIYRRARKGPAYKVSSEERDRFVEQFRRRNGRFMWVLVPGIVAAIVLGMIFMPQYFGEGKRDGSLLLIVPTILVIVLFVRRSYAAPMRDLERRAPVAPKLTREEWHAVHFSSLGWPILLLPTIIAAIIGATMASRLGEASWQDIAWLVGASLYLLLGSRAIILKWRYRDDGGVT